MTSYHLRSLGAVLVLLAGTTAACSGDGADRSVAVGAHDYAYSGLDGFVGKAGEKVEFVLTNAGAADHELEIFGPDGKALGEIEPVAAGHTGKATFSLKTPGRYRYTCGVSDHEERGMGGTFEVR